MSAPSVAAGIQRALAAFRAGQLPLAEAACRGVIALDHRNFVALQLLGVCFIKSGRPRDAIREIARALKVNPNSAEAHYNLGHAWSDLGDVRKAHDSFRKAAFLSPDDAEYHLELGNSLKLLERIEEAMQSFRRAIDLRPDYAEAHNALGACLRELERYEEAVSCYRTAIRLRPRYAEAHGNLGNVLHDLERYREAVASFDEAIALKPGYVEAYLGIGNALSRLENRSAALRSYDKAISLRPDYPEAHNARGACLVELQMLEEAIVSIDRALALKADYAEAHSSKALALEAAGEFNQALPWINRALELKPDKAGFYNVRHAIWTGLREHRKAVQDLDLALSLDPENVTFSVNRAHGLLRAGEFIDGLQSYEFRLDKLEFDKATTLGWNNAGKSLTGRNIYVQWEQGFGDTIQFCRYVALFESLGASVYFKPQPALVRLMRGLHARCVIIDDRQNSESAAESFDLKLSLLSSMHAFGTTLDTVPAPVPYLSAEEERQAYWRSRLDQKDHEILVGVCWQGSTNPIDRGRSFPLSCLSSISRLPNVRLISLHKGKGEGQLESLPPDMRIEVLGADLDSTGDAFIDSAAVISLCDLVISSDTAIAHLSGALGTRTWVALKFTPDWRWLLDREDCPWYPTMRLFRQRSFGNWDEVFERMEQELRDLSRSQVLVSSDGDDHE